MPPRKRLGQLLTNSASSTSNQLQSCARHQSNGEAKLGAICCRRDLRRGGHGLTLAKHLGMPRVRLAEVKVDPRAVKYVSKQNRREAGTSFPYEIQRLGRSEG